MDDVIGYIRVIPPRYVLAGQKEAMDAQAINRLLVDDRKTSRAREALVRMVRTGTVVAIRHLFLLACPKAGRRDLWKAIDAIEARGGVLWELYSDRRTSDKKQRDEMMREAVEALARGRHKRSAADKRGRPRKDFTAQEIEQARAVWHNRKVRTWAEVKVKLPSGFSLARAYKSWGPRT